MPAKDDMPSTLKRSPKKAQETYVKTHDHAVEEYGEGARAHRTAFAALKHSFQKKGDRWVPKGHKGPSGETYGGVDYEGSTREEFYRRAKKLDVAGRSGMSKKELARAVARKQ
jgi:cation transport regulator ChaB